MRQFDKTFTNEAMALIMDIVPRLAHFALGRKTMSNLLLHALNDSKKASAAIARAVSREGKDILGGQCPRGSYVAWPLRGSARARRRCRPPVMLAHGGWAA